MLKQFVLANALLGTAICSTNATAAPIVSATHISASPKLIPFTNSSGAPSFPNEKVNDDQGDTPGAAGVSITDSLSSVPEPVTFGLVGSGLCAIALIRRRTKR